MRHFSAVKGVVILGGIYAAMGVFSPIVFGRLLEVSKTYFLEMAMIMPAVVLLMGLFEVWVPKDAVQRYLGQSSGLRGIILAFLLGTLPTGPLYVAFPLAAGLVKKGARVSNIVVFLGAWAAAKIPQIAMEAKFLGVRFATGRLALTVLFTIAMGFIAERILAGQSPTGDLP